MNAQDLLQKYTTWGCEVLPNQTETVISTEDAIAFAKEYARVKCLETAKNVRHMAVDIMLEVPDNGGSDSENELVDILSKRVNNIKDQTILPKFD